MRPRLLPLLLLFLVLALPSGCVDPFFVALDEPFDRDGDGVTGERDCAEGDPTRATDLEELCDGVDNDCDGDVDEGLGEDRDGDGHVSPGDCGELDDDCNDDDPTVHGGAEELCDGIDNDCDQEIDEGTATETWFTDADGDGFGQDGTEQLLCPGDDTAGLAPAGGDCDDSRLDVHPGFDERCDGIDNDCDESIDEGLSVDGDGDGHSVPGSCQEPADDCDDDDASRNPGLEEVCDGIDNDCDFEIDEGLRVDADGDGHAVPGSCGGLDDDCDDTEPLVYGGASELCDGLDNDCNGLVDDEITDVTWFGDADGDGWGSAGSGTVVSCSRPDDGSWATLDGDCDDDAPDINPGADEACTGMDDDCDGLVDGADPDTDVDLDGVSLCDGDCSDVNPWAYPGAAEICDGPTPELNADNDCDGLDDSVDDGDGDGFAICDDCDDTSDTTYPEATEACDGSDNDCDGGVDEDGDGDGVGVCDDCDDGNPEVYPFADEACDGLDNDCDGDVDEGLTVDLDGDGSPGPGSCDAAEEDCDDDDPTRYPGAAESCNGIDDDCDGSLPAEELDGDADGLSGCEGDCNDADPEVRPGAAEVCNGSDDDCDGSLPTDETDADGDGARACDGDCDDSDPEVRPGATELCNGLDDNCDGIIAGSEADLDGDGFRVCDGSEGTDCRDDDPDIYPGAEEVCDGADSDCDGVVPDEEADADGDGELACLTDCDDDDPDRYRGAPELCNGLDDNCNGDIPVEEADADADGSRVCDGDCDDTNPAVAPDAAEACDGIDNDCDGDIDEGGSITWYRDEDGDGYGLATDSVEDCSGPPGYVPSDTDCDDTNPSAYPGGTEVCDGADNDCDGETDEGTLLTYYTDGDGDGYGDTDATVEACSPPAGASGFSGDCDDGNPSVYPGAPELCDALDNDCDEDVDEGVSATWHRDRDSDGFGGSETIEACSPPLGYVADSSDCNDTNAFINPTATEVCDGEDNDCDTEIDEGVASEWFEDADSDGFGNSASSELACAPPTDYVASGGDCNDSEPTIFPGAPEVCDSLDNDCDEDVDEGVVLTFFDDDDGDGFGANGSEQTGCEAPAGVVFIEGDCDDGAEDVFPGAEELCNDTDDDCDGSQPWWDQDGDGDGVLACNQAAWVCSDSTGTNNPSYGGNYGSRDSADLLEDEGVAWDAYILDSVLLTSAWLEDITILVLYGKGHHGPLLSSEQTALQNWVASGGRLLYFGWDADYSTCPMVDSLPSAFGISCDLPYSDWSGWTDSVVSHPVTDGIGDNDVGGYGGERWSVTFPAETLMSDGGIPVVVAAEYGDGRVVGVSDEWPFYNSGSGSRDIGDRDHEDLNINIWSWLHEW